MTAAIKIPGDNRFLLSAFCGQGSGPLHHHSARDRRRLILCWLAWLSGLTNQDGPLLPFVLCLYSGELQVPSVTQAEYDCSV